MAVSAATILSYASSEIGLPYQWGAEKPGVAFDCSGLTQWSFGQAGVRLPRTAHEQQSYVTAVSNPQPGDLVFYGSPAHHVAIYAGGGQMIEAPHTGADVRLVPVRDGATYGRAPGVVSSGSVTAAFNNVVGTTYSVGQDWAAKAGSFVTEGMFVLLGVGIIGGGIFYGLKGNAA